MKKILLPLIALLLLCTVYVSADNVTVKETRSVATGKIELKEGEQWRGYFDGNYQNLQYIGFGVQFPWLPMDYDCAIKIPMGRGLTIQGIKFPFRNLQNITDVKIWLSRKPLDLSYEDADICVQDVSIESLSPVSEKDNGYSINEIRFNEPYKIEGNEDIYIGYSFAVQDNVESYDVEPIVVTNRDIPTEENAFFLNFGLGFADCVDAYYGNLAIQVLTTGEYEGCDVAEMDNTFDQKVFVKDEVKELKAKVYNKGRKPIKSLSYVIITDGVANEEAEVFLEKEIEPMKGVLEYNFPFVCESTGVREVSIMITKVNGVENKLNNTSTGKVVIISNKVKHVPVFEEMTSTQNGAAPFGKVARHRAKEYFGNDAVMLAFHVDVQEQGREPMECGIYDKFKYTYDWFPGAHINRSMLNIHPYFTTCEVSEFALVNTLKDFINTTVSEAEIKVEGLVSEDNSNINVTSTTKFMFSSTENDYAVAVMLVADSLRGSGDEWMQKNELVDYKGTGYFEYDEMLVDWINSTDFVETYYNDVPIDGKGIDNGIEGSIASPIVENEEQKYDVVFDITNNELVQNINNLSVCAMLINTKTGVIVNADRKPVKFATSISNINADENAKIEYYTIDGQKISTPKKGIVIVKYPDNKVVKQIIK